MRETRRAAAHRAPEIANVVLQALDPWVRDE